MTRHSDLLARHNYATGNGQDRAGRRLGSRRTKNAEREHDEEHTAARRHPPSIAPSTPSVLAGASHRPIGDLDVVTLSQPATGASVAASDAALGRVPVLSSGRQIPTLRVGSPKRDAPDRRNPVSAAAGSDRWSLPLSLRSGARPGSRIRRRAVAGQRSDGRSSPQLPTARRFRAALLSPLSVVREQGRTGALSHDVFHQQLVFPPPCRPAEVGLGQDAAAPAADLLVGPNRVFVRRRGVERDAVVSALSE
jgi:hypothetical protein